MNWIAFVVIGQFLNAFVILVDRYIVAGKKILDPLVYTFYVSILSIFVLVLLPFGVTIPSISTMWLSLIAAISYFVSIYFLYRSLVSSNPSEVVPVIGGVAALSTFLFSSIFLAIGLPSHFIAGFFVLTAGMLLISHFRFTLDSFMSLTASGVAFGLSTVLIKMIFLNDTFINGFFWSRMANVLIAIALLLIPGMLKKLHHDKRESPSSGKWLILGNKFIGGTAFLFTLLAIKYGEVSMVNALVALQYVYLLIFAFFFSKQMPEYFTEKFHKHEILHKTSATLIIMLGFFILFFQ